MLALPISMPRYKSIIFMKIVLNLGYFFKKMQNFQALGAPSPGPVPLSSGDFAPRPRFAPKASGFGEILKALLLRVRGKRIAIIL